MTRIFHRLFLWKWIPCQAVTCVLCLLFRPKTVHCSTKNAYTSEITFLALVPCTFVGNPKYKGCTLYIKKVPTNILNSKDLNIGNKIAWINIYLISIIIKLVHIKNRICKWFSCFWTSATRHWKLQLGSRHIDYINLLNFTVYRFVFVSIYFFFNDFLW